MNRTALDTLRALLPHLNDTELQVTFERLQRYVRLAIEVVRDDFRPDLTAKNSRGSVDAGQVDPSTFTNTG